MSDGEQAHRLGAKMIALLDAERVEPLEAVVAAVTVCACTLVNAFENTNIDLAVVIRRAQAQLEADTREIALRSAVEREARRIMESSSGGPGTSADGETI